MQRSWGAARAVRRGGRRTSARAIAALGLLLALLGADPARAVNPVVLVPSGVSDYAIAGSAVYWTSIPNCAGLSGDANQPVTLSRVASYGGTPRTLLSENAPRPPTSCNPFLLYSNIVADVDFIYFARSSPGLAEVVRLSRLANPGDAPQHLVFFEVPPSGYRIELSLLGNDVYAIAHYPTTLNASLVVVFPKVGGLPGVVATAPLGSYRNLQTRESFVYFNDSSSGFLRRWDSANPSGSDVPLVSGVTAYAPDGMRFRFNPPFGFILTDWVFTGISHRIFRWDNTDSSFFGPVYTGVDPFAFVTGLVTAGNNLYFVERTPTGGFDAFHRVLRKDLSTGAPALLHARQEIGDLDLLRDDGSNLFWLARGPRTVETLPNDAAALPFTNLRVTAIEVTQGIQDLARSVPLVEGRRTAVRVHVRSDGPAVTGVTARLTGSDANGGFLGAFDPMNHAANGAPLRTLTVQSSPDRNNVNDSFLFEIPVAWTSIPGLRLHAELNPSRIPYEPGYADNGMDVGPLAFVASPRLTVGFLNFQYLLGNALISVSPSDVFASRQRMNKLYPLAPNGGFRGQGQPGLAVTEDLVLDNGLLPRVQQTHPDCASLAPKNPGDDDRRNECASNYVHARIAAMRAAGDIPDDRRWYGDIAQISAALLTRGYAVFATRIGSGPSGSTPMYINYAAHEIGHLLGRAHPTPGAAACDHSASDPAYPYEDGAIAATGSDPQSTFAGYDDGFPGGFASILPGRTNFDIMTYCPPWWISDYTYTGILSFLQANPSGAPEEAASAPGDAGAPVAGDWLVTAGTIVSDRGTASLTSVARRDSVASVPPLVPGPYALRLLTAGGGLLAEHAFTPSPGGEDGVVASFALVVPFAPGTRQLRLFELASGSVMAAQTLSPASPVVSNVTVQTGSQNLAREPGATVSQSSTGLGGVAARAVDGNRSGDWANASVTHTNVDLHAWLEVDLGAVKPIGRIDLFLRTDCCVDRNRIAVLASSQPFAAADFGQPLLPVSYSNGALQVYRTTGAFDVRHVSIPVTTSARYVRVVHLETGMLSVAELELQAGLVTTWAASDTDADALRFDLLFTRDAGTTFRPLQLGISGTQTVVDGAALGGGTGILRVVASDGVQTGHSDSAPFALPNRPPVPRIGSPADGGVVAWGQPVTFSGEALDVQDGAVAGSGLVWSTQRRALGSGALLSVADLEVGANVVTLTATNSLGVSAATSITLQVGDDVALPGPLLAVGPQSLGWSVASGTTQVQSATLSVANAGGGTLGFGAASSAAWLSPTPNGGNAPNVLTVTADPTGMTDGTTLIAEIVLTVNADPSQVVHVPVSLSMGNVFDATGTADADGDGVADAQDDCVLAADPEQIDTGGIGAGSAPDGIGDACQCGDVNGDGFVSIADATILARSLLTPPTAAMSRPALCDVGGSAGCTLSDAVIVRRALLVPPTASVALRCQQTAP